MAIFCNTGDADLRKIFVPFFIIYKQLPCSMSDRFYICSFMKVGVPKERILKVDNGGYS